MMWYISNKKGRFLSIKNRKVSWVMEKHFKAAKGFNFRDDAIQYAENRKLTDYEVKMPGYYQ